MSIGNLKTEGGKGTNWPWQYRMLKGLQGIIDVINSTANGSEYEAKLVNITCTGVPFNGTELYLEVRVWDTVTGGFTGNPTYYLPGSTVGVPLATFTDAGCDITYLEAGDATEVTLQAVLDELKDDLADKTVIPVMLRKTGNAVAGTPDTITDAVKAISFANYSSVNAEISVIDNYPTTPATYSLITLKPGEVINLDAGGNANAFPVNTFKYEPDTVAPNTNGDLLITYTK
jgi:hypothetical protein